MGTWTAKRMAAKGFSLIELLVVLLIFAILIAIAVPSLIASQPERNLAAAAERFANDMNYARSKAEATGNTVFVGFQFGMDEDNIEGRVDETETNGGVLGGLLGGLILALALARASDTIGRARARSTPRLPDKTYATSAPKASFSFASSSAERLV